MFQEITIIGHLGNDPELRYTQSGKPVASFSVAVNNTRKTPDGEAVKETIWFRISAWDKTAENCSQYLSKGRLVMVKGTLRADNTTGGPRIYERKDGNSGASFEVNASVVKFLGGTPASSDAGAYGDKPQAAAEGGDESGDSEIPF